MDRVYEFVAELDITPSAAERTYKRLYEGIGNLQPALNEVLDQEPWLSGQGHGRTDVTGMQLTLNLTGKRVVGDEVQDYCFSPGVMFGLGTARRTTLRLTFPDGMQIVQPVTLANLSPGGGAANNGSAIAINIHGNGAPQITASGQVIGQLTVVSVAGTTPGDTAVYVNPAVTGTNTYVYRTAVAVDIPAYDAVLTTGWTAWDGEVEITATTGNVIVIAEIDGDNKAKKAGKATVTAA